MKKIVRMTLGLALGALFSWLIFRHLSINELENSFRDANVSLVIAAIAFFFLGYSCRIERWRLMLLQDNQALQWGNCAGPLMASVAANNVLPFRAGDLLRAFGFNKRLGIQTATSLTTLFVERLLDLLMVVGFLGLALTAFGMDCSRFVRGGGTFLIAVAICILAVLVFPHVFMPLAMWCIRLLVRVSPKLGGRALIGVQNVFSALEHTAKGRTIVKLIFWSMLAWVAEGLVFWLLAQALPSIVNHYAAWLALPVGTLATVIPSTPGYVGTFDFFTTQAMTALGNSVAASTAYSLLVHTLIWLPPTVVGGLYLLLNPVKH